MLARHAHDQLGAAVPPRQRSGGTTSFDTYVGDHDIGRVQRTTSTSVSHDAQALGPRRGRQAHRALVLRAGHQEAPGHHAASELDENLLKLLARVVAIQMIGLHVCHDLDGRRIVQERAIRLIGLGDEHVTRTQVRTRPQLRQNAAHRHGRIQPARRQCNRQHARRRRLTVRARHADETHARRGQRQCLRAVDNPLPALTRDRQFRVALADRRGHHDDGSRVHVGGIMTDVDSHAYRTQMLEDTGILTIRPLNRRAARGQQLRDDAHSRAADTNQMETIPQRRLTHGRPPSPVPMPDPPAREPRPHAPATARQPPSPPDASTPAAGRRCCAQSRR